MTLPLATLSLACALALAPTAVSARVTVTFAEKDGYTDASDRATTPERVREALKEHLERVAERYVPGETDLRIEVLDIDLAGSPHRTRHDVRIITGRADAPCIELTTSLAGSPPKKERVCDLGYMRSLPAGYHSDQFLVYEKRMLDDWFRKTFAQGKR